MSKMKTLKFLALTAIFVTLFTNSEMLFAQSGTYTTCFNCGGMGFITLYSPYGSYTTYCPGCGGTGQIKVPEFKATDWWNYSGGGNNSGGNVPVNTYSGSYDNNNTNTQKTNKGLEKAKEYYDSYGEKDCHLCHGSGTCSTCNGKGWYYSSYGTGKVDCPNCCYSNKGKCGKCCGTGKVYGKKY